MRPIVSDQQYINTILVMMTLKSFRIMNACDTKQRKCWISIQILTLLRSGETTTIAWSVGNVGWNEWLSWEIVINDHCLGSVSNTEQEAEENT